MPGESYQSAGVDFGVADNIKQTIQALARITHTKQVIGGVGGFAGLYRLGEYKDPVLVSSTDGVGTKLKIANTMGHLESLGMDLVYQTVNDIIPAGARPLFFLDYISMGSLQPQQVDTLLRGIVWSCRQVGCALIGGETAEQPGLYSGDDFDLAGFVVGAVESSQVIDPSSIIAGDILLGISSSGLHTNGFSLVRKVFRTDEDHRILYKHFQELGHTLGEELLIPHRCYYPLLEPVFRHVKGMAHISGGGIPGNLPRVLPNGLSAQVNTFSWNVPPIFSLIQNTGAVEPQEMYRVFNMGLGMILVCSPNQVDTIREKVPEAIIVGEIVPLEEGCGRAVELLA